MLTLLQHCSMDGTRNAVSVRNSAAQILTGLETVYDMALATIAGGVGLAEIVAITDHGPEIDPHSGLEAGRFMAPIDHADPAHVVVTGTGLTHLGSAEGRDRRHRASAAGEQLTNPMRLLLEGVEAGKPALGAVGQQPCHGGKMS